MEQKRQIPNVIKASDEDTQFDIKQKIDNIFDFHTNHINQKIAQVCSKNFVQNSIAADLMKARKENTNACLSGCSYPLYENLSITNDLLNLCDEYANEYNKYIETHINEKSIICAKEKLISIVPDALQNILLIKIPTAKEVYKKCFPDLLTGSLEYFTLYYNIINAPDKIQIEENEFSRATDYLLIHKYIEVAKTCKELENEINKLEFIIDNKCPISVTISASQTDKIIYLNVYC